MKLRVYVDFGGCVGLAVAALVGRDDVITGIRHCRQLVTPRIPRLRKAVAQHYERTRTRFGNVHVDAVCCDCAVMDLCHFSPVNSRGLGL